MSNPRTTADAFTATPAFRTTRQQLQQRTVSLHATLTPPPAEAEEEKEKNKKQNSSDEWTPTKEGNFIPNIFKRKGKQQKQRNASPITEVTDIQAYKDEVVDVPDRMVVVRFYAPWCRSCKAVEPLFKKMASQHSPSIKFVDVPVTKENAYLHEGLGIPSVPFGHIYHPDVGLVEEKKLNKKDFKEFKEVFEHYVAGECEIPSEEDQTTTEKEEEQPFM